MPSIYVPDDWAYKIASLLKKDPKEYVKAAVREKMKQDGINVK